MEEACRTIRRTMRHLLRDVLDGVVSMRDGAAALDRLVEENADEADFLVDMVLRPSHARVLSALSAYIAEETALDLPLRPHDWWLVYQRHNSALAAFKVVVDRRFPDTYKALVLNARGIDFEWDWITTTRTIMILHHQGLLR